MKVAPQSHHRRVQTVPLVMGLAQLGTIVLLGAFPQLHALLAASATPLVNTQ